MMRSWVLFGGIVSVVGVGVAAAAGPRSEAPRPCPNVCDPNVGGFGYFPTMWRQWPGELRQELVNPRSFGAEVVPTPAGREELPLPRAQTPLKSAAPEWNEPITPPPPSIAPPGGVTLPQAQYPMPALPAEPIPSKPLDAPIQNVLPPIKSLDAPIQNGIAPLKPLDAPIQNALPGLPVESKPALPPIPPTTPKEQPVTPVKPAAPMNPTESKAKNAFQTPAVKEPFTLSAPVVKEPFTTATVVVKEPFKAPAPTVNVVKEPIAPASAWHEPVQRIVAASEPVSRPPAESTPKISLIVGGEPSHGHASGAASRAHWIAETPPASPREIEGVAYVSDESTKLHEMRAAENRAAVPTVALNGYCAVELAANGRWVPGDIRWTVVHKGWIYRLSGPEQLKRFQEYPDLFAPANAGNDPVLAMDENRAMPGIPAHCAMFKNRLYMFSSVATQAKFNQSPQRYALGK